MKPEAFLCIVLLSLLIPSVTSANQSTPAKNPVYITEQFPPFSYQEDGKMQGISVDLLEKMLEHMNTTLNRSEIKLLPWDQGYQMALQDNNTVIFSTGRIPEREALFKWVGPISSIKVVLFALNDQSIHAASKFWLSHADPLCHTAYVACIVLPIALQVKAHRARAIRYGISRLTAIECLENARVGEIPPARADPPLTSPPDRRIFANILIS